MSAYQCGTCGAFIQRSVQGECAKCGTQWKNEHTVVNPLSRERLAGLVGRLRVDAHQILFELHPESRPNAVRDLLTKCADGIEFLLREHQWRPIETAPKGRHDVIDLWCVGIHDDIAFYCPDFCAVGRQDAEGNHLYQGRVSRVQWRLGAWRPKSNLLLHAITVTPTHWSPLPEPPQ